jgi:hypothetical protein
MQNLSGIKKNYYRLLGQLYFWTYVTTLREVMGVKWSWFLRRFPLVFIVAGFLLEWGWVTLLLLLLVVLANVVYWVAARAGYNKFVGGTGGTAVAIPDDELIILPPNEKIHLRATGLFGVRDEEAQVLLRPADYWQIPLGDHIVMVERAPGRYMYQFFNAASLQKVEEGWLIFGREPREALAVTFRSRWTPTFAQFEVRYYVQDEEPTAPLRTVYLTFENEEHKRSVWHNIIRDARRVRA